MHREHPYPLRIKQRLFNGYTLFPLLYISMFITFLLSPRHWLHPKKKVQRNFTVVPEQIRYQNLHKQAQVLTAKSCDQEHTSSPVYV